ncbi:hypothetical protein COCVIDRAFT_18174 [Bipolaris victoriae FI3]|uniref:Uncharacterized protein n=1 Tax=Bipolaris victoriae (strain FI3) TaxID=930091 RepID=W7E1Y1_BIPV3|nr:hypothetical protein COCVIDRAFT_18174 [Bipolaris victoriae FI3]
MHLLRFFSVAAVTASMALALPAEIPQVATSELQTVPAAEALANLPPADDIFVRNTPGDVSTKSSSYESESKALAIRASPTRKNIFTITLHGYEYKKNFLGTDITRVTASVQSIFKAASGTIYTFPATVAYTSERWHSGFAFRISKFLFPRCQGIRKAESLNFSLSTSKK